AAERIALEHLLEQARAATCRMSLLTRGLEARTHREAPEIAALRHPEAALDRGRERAFIFRKREPRRQLRRPVVGAEAKPLVELHVADEPIGIHLPVGIPDPLELVKCLHQLRSEHLRQQLRTTMPLAVLAGQRSTV